MKDHAEEGRPADLGDGMPVEAAIAILKAAADGLVNPRIQRGWDQDDINVIGWRPMTDVEKKRAEDRRKRARHASAIAKAKREKNERELLAKLKEKYESEEDR
jgi:hypothetical protein